MKKFLLVTIFIAISLVVGCGGTVNTDIGVYELSDTDCEYYVMGLQAVSQYKDKTEETHVVEYEQLPDDHLNTPARPQSAVSISAASSHALALMEDGTLWGWGGSVGWDGGSHSLVGDGTAELRSLPVWIMDDVTFAVAGHNHSFAITADGALWAWGCNRWGQIGDGTTEFRLSPVKVMDDVVYATMPMTVPNSHVDEGARSYAIRSDGSLWAWGANGFVDAFAIALGDGTDEVRNLPVQILENVISVVPTQRGGFAITNDRRLWAWHNEILWFCVENDTWETKVEARLYPAPIMENVAWLSPCATFAITTESELWSHLLEPAWVMDDVVYATGLNGANFAVKSDGTLLAWGRNRLPSHWRPGILLGDGTTIDRDAPVVILENIASVTVMGNTIYALAKDGTLWGWGSDTMHGYLFEEHMWEYAYDDNGFPSGMRWLLDDDGGTGLRLSPVKILENVIYVAPTYHMFDHGWVRGARAFALTECGSIWAWGENDFHDLGLNFLGDGTSESRLVPIRIIDGTQ